MSSTITPLMMKSSEREAKNFLVYWRPETVESQFRLNSLLEYAGSEQFDDRVQPGDTLWIVSSRDGVLYLLGRLVVGMAMSTAEIEALGHTDLWNSTRHVLAAEGTAQPMQQIRLNEVAADLSFQSTRAPRLKIEQGRVNAQSLQAMRQLTTESAAMLSRIWEPLPR